MAELSELGKTTNAIRWLWEIHDKGAVPGEIQEAAKRAATELDDLRRKYFNPRAIEQSIARAWGSQD
jgi:hypothetical protein